MSLFPVNFVSEMVSNLSTLSSPRRVIKRRKKTEAERERGSVEAVGSETR